MSPGSPDQTRHPKHLTTRAELHRIALLQGRARIKPAADEEALLHVAALWRRLLRQPRISIKYRLGRA